MKKLVSVLCTVLALAACEKDDANTIKIGAVLPMTGANAPFGLAMRAGMESAIKDKGDTKYKYKIVFEDGQQLPAKSISAAQKLISADNVRVLVSNMTGIGRAIAPVAESANVLALNATLEQEVAEPMGKTTFFQGPSAESYVKHAVSALKKSGVKSVAVIAANLGPSCPTGTKIAEILSKQKIKTAVECFNPGERDFKFVSDKYQGYDAYYIGAFPPESEILMRQLYKMGVAHNQVYGQGLDFGQDTSLFQDVNHIAATLGNMDFVNRIIKEYDLKNQNMTSVAYDLVSLTVDAFEAVGPDNMDGIYEYIKKNATRDCMSGKCKLLPNGFIVNEAEWRTYHDGKPVVFEK